MKDKLNRISLILHALLSFALFFLIEWMARQSFYGAYSFMKKSPMVFSYNVFLIFTTYIVVYLFRRRIFFRTLITVIWLTLGITNGVLLTKRVTPFTGPDVKLVFDALALMNNYFSKNTFIMIAIGFVLGIIALIILWIKAPKYKGKMNYFINIVGVGAVIAAFTFTTNAAINNRILATYFGNIAFAYQDYGFPYCLAASLFVTGMDAPRNYSEEYIKELVDYENKKETTEEREGMPNIIMVQLESFFDPTLVEFLELSEDPLPNFRQLEKDFSSGYFKVPSVGAGTANTEFEVNTGMNLRYFGPGEYPYKTILKKSTCESAAFDLAGLGYTSHAIHNNTATFYDRWNVFSKLGFNTFTTKEFMDVKEKTITGWVKDKILVGTIMDCLKSSKKQDYIFSISVQGHGNYPEEPVLEDPKIKVTNLKEDEKKRNSWEYYVNQLYEMDQFIKELTDTLEDYGEDTVVVFYGDHLPTLNLSESDVKNRYLFQTEYAIWDNMGLEQKDQNLASYQIMSEVMDQVDIHTGTIFQYHQNRRKTKDYLPDLEELQYDILYGKKYAYGGENPYQPTDLKLGVNDFEITGTGKTDNGYSYVLGNYFSQRCRVTINGEQVNTKFINNTTLLLKDKQLKSGDHLAIDIMGSKDRVLRTSETYLNK